MNIDHIFRAYDIRGIVDKDLTESTMENIAKAFGTYIHGKGYDRVTIGGDIRGTTQRLLDAFERGITSCGISVDIVKQSPLGVTLFNSFEKKYGASAFITASHMPPEWNGVKFYWGEGIGFSPVENTAFKEIFDSGNFVVSDTPGSSTEVDPFPNYVNYLKTKFDINVGKNFRVAIDCGNGATSLVVPKLFEELGFEVIPLFDTPDPTFPNRTSEPNEKSLAQLGELVRRSDVHFGAGFDGDGDRCVFSDEKGNIISADAFGIISARYLVSEGRNNVIINMECSQAMEDQLKQLGANVKRIRVGHSFLSLEAKELDAVWGVEASGHAVAPDYFLFDDALILPLIFALALDKLQRPISELVAEIPLPIKQRFDIKCSDQVKFKVVEKMASKLARFDGEVSDLDGVALTTSYGRILVRASNTGPKVRATLESSSEDGFAKLKEFLPLVDETIAELS